MKNFALAVAFLIFSTTVKPVSFMSATGQPFAGSEGSLRSSILGSFALSGAVISMFSMRRGVNELKAPDRYVSISPVVPYTMLALTFIGFGATAPVKINDYKNLCSITDEIKNHGCPHDADENECVKCQNIEDKVFRDACIFYNYVVLSSDTGVKDIFNSDKFMELDEKEEAYSISFNSQNINFDKHQDVSSLQIMPKSLIVVFEPEHGYKFISNIEDHILQCAYGL